MAGPLIFLTLTQRAPIEAHREAHAEALRVAYETLGAKWAEEYLPRHFTPEAARLYGHQPRKPRTLKRKLAAARIGAAKFGGRVDNVFTGLMMTAILAHQRIQARSTGVDVRLFGPRYFFQYDRRRGMPQKAKEVSTVLPEEMAALARVADRAYVDHIHRVIGGTTKTTKLGDAA